MRSCQITFDIMVTRGDNAANILKKLNDLLIANRATMHISAMLT